MAIGQFNTPVFDTSGFDNLQVGTPEYEAAKQRAAKMKGYMNSGIGMDTTAGTAPTMMQPNSGLFKQQSNPQSIGQGQGDLKMLIREKDHGENISREKDLGQDVSTTTTTKPATTPTTTTPTPSPAAQPINYRDTFNAGDSQINVYQDRRTALIKQLDETKDPQARAALHKQINEVEAAIKKVHRVRYNQGQAEKAEAAKEKQDEKTASKRMDVRGVISREKKISIEDVTEEEINNYMVADTAKKKAESDARVATQVAKWQKENPNGATPVAPPAARQSTEDFVRGRRNQYDQKLYALFAEKIITQDDLNRKLRQEPNYPAMDALFGQLTGTFTNSGDGPDQHGKNPGAFVPPTDTTATPRPGDTQAPTSRGPDRPLRPLQEGGGLAPIPEGQTTAQAQRIGTTGERMAENEKNIAANKLKNEEAARQNARNAASARLTGPVNPDYVDGKGVDTRDTETGGQQGMENASSVEDFIYGLLNDPTGVGSDLKPQAPMGAKQAKQDKAAKLKADVAKLKKQQEDAEKDQSNALFNAATKQEAYRKKLK